MHPLSTCRLRPLATTLALVPFVALAAPLQLTPTTGLNSFGASVSDDGNRVAFYSASNPTGGNADTVAPPRSDFPSAIPVY